MSILNEISENLQRGKAKIVRELVEKALNDGVSPTEILSDGLLAGMSVIGEKFKNNEVYVPEVLVAARAMNMGTQVLKPHLAQSGVQAAINENCNIICCSALLTTTMGVMEEIVRAAEAAGIRDKVKIMVGGAPVTEEFCRRIGADCYTSDAASAADAAVLLCKA